MSERAKVAEKRAADARSETSQQLKARIAEARASAKQRRDDLHECGTKTKEEITSRWLELRDDVRKNFGKLQDEIDKRQDDHDAKGATNAVLAGRPIQSFSW